MTITRRNILSRLTATVVSGMTFPALLNFSLAEAMSSGTISSARPIRLSANENAYGPSESVLAAMQECLSGGNRYPEVDYISLLTKLSASHRIKPGQIVAGAGSSEVLGLVAAAYLRPGKRLVQPSPTCALMSNFARNQGSEIINVPLTGSFDVDFKALQDQSDSRTAVVYLCNPNNPTGILAARKNIESFLKKLPEKTMLVVDEAYHHFVTATSIYPSLLDYPIDDNRVIVTRTFSKLYGLAGIRVGYLVASPAVAFNLSLSRVLPSVSGIAARAAAAALDDPDYLRMAARRNANDRQEFINQAGTRMLPVINSHANFLMLKCPCPANDVFDHMKKHNILLTPPVPEMNEYIRVSLGTPAEMLQFWHVWDLMPVHTMSM